jgi:hypothetical protein
MRDVTELMNNYREACRLLWNRFYRAPDSDFETVSAFEHVCQLVFQDLVLAELGRTDIAIRRPPAALEFLRVIPIADTVPIMVNRSGQGQSNTYWDDPLREIRRDDALLFYQDCYDWDVRGFRDFHYYLVELRGHSQRPDLDGRKALIEAPHARVMALE